MAKPEIKVVELPLKITPPEIGMLFSISPVNTMVALIHDMGVMLATMGPPSTREETVRKVSAALLDAMKAAHDSIIEAPTVDDAARAEEIAENIVGMAKAKAEGREG